MPTAEARGDGGLRSSLLSRGLWDSPRPRKTSQEKEEQTLTLYSSALCILGGNLTKPLKHFHSSFSFIKSGMS